jgi:transposase
MSTSSHTPPTILTEAATFIGIDYHKKYSVYHAVDAAGKGRIEHHSPHDFANLVKRWLNARVVFEASMNWHWLYEALEQSIPGERITLTNAYKTRIIAEAQVKTDKIDARILALLLRTGLVSSVHIPCKETRQRKEVLRQR